MFKYKHILQYLFLFIIAIALALLQFSLVSSLAFPWNNLNLVFLAIIFTFLAVGSCQAFFLAISAACFLDIWSFYPFGLFIFSLLLSTLIVYLILENFLTNRSLYSFLLLTLLGLILESFLYHIFLLVFDWSVSFNSFFLTSASFWQSLLWSLLLNLLILALFFNLLALASRRLQPFFLKRR